MSNKAHTWGGYTRPVSFKCPGLQLSKNHSWYLLKGVVIALLLYGGLDHLWYQILHHESTLYVIREFYANFQLPSMIKSTSRIQSYLEDVNGFWLELWMIGSILLCWIILWHPQEVSHKVLWRSDLIWLKYLQSKILEN